jgi:hypothetical protein
MEAQFRVAKQQLALMYKTLSTNSPNGSSKGRLVSILCFFIYICESILHLQIMALYCVGVSSLYFDPSYNFHLASWTVTGEY